MKYLVSILMVISSLFTFSSTIFGQDTKEKRDLQGWGRWTPKLTITVDKNADGCEVNYQGRIIGMGPLQKRPLIKLVNEVIDLIEQSM